MKSKLDIMLDNGAWTVFLSNGKQIKIPALELKSWQTSEKILRNSFITLMERESETVFLGYWMSHLIYHSEDNAKIFLDFLLNSKTNMKLWHTGVCWHVLFHCLEKCDGLKALLCTTPPSSYIEKLVTLFCNQMKTGLSQGTLAKLKPLLSEEQILSIQSKLEERQIICDFFTDFANQLSNYKIDKTFLEYSKKHSFIFFRAFSHRMLRIIYKGDGHVLEQDILAFRNCIHRVAALQANFCRNWFKEQLGRLLMKTDRIYPAMDHLNKIFTMTWAKYHADEIIGKTVVNQYYCDPETLEKGTILGEGTYGTARLVRIKELANEVVAKLFGNINKDTITLINGELECLIRMQSHPNIVHIYGYLVKNGHYEGIIMEYCRGGDLYSVIKKPKTYIDEAKVLNWTRQAACGLMYLHQNKMIHRDVKPQNMLLNSDCSILKLGDFGLIKFLSEPVDKKSYEGELQSIFGLKRDVDNHTVSHEQYDRATAVEASWNAGTKGFRAPEIENWDFYTAVVDVFSLGRSMWYMIFGQNFKGNTLELMEKLEAATLGESSNPLEPSFEPSDQLNELVLNMMLQDQFKRPSMEMVYEILSVWMDQSSTQMATVEQN